MEERSVLSWAKEYYEKGYSIIPLEKGGKRPTLKWQKYQKERATLSDLEAWFKDGGANVGLVTGQLSGAYVLDIDTRHGGDEASVALVARDATCTTGGGGRHHYFSWFGGLLQGGNTASLLSTGIDTRGEGGYVVCPPSVTTGPYTFCNGKDVPEPKRLPGIPDGILKKLLFTKRVTDNGRENEKCFNKAGSFVPVSFVPAREGSRNCTAARVAGSIARGCGSYSRGMDALRLWNHAECIPALGEPELKAVWDSIWRKAASETVTGDERTDSGGPD